MSILTIVTILAIVCKNNQDNRMEGPVEYEGRVHLSILIIWLNKDK
jgi:hypothetical protein